jgi:hypothetical protein
MSTRRVIAVVTAAGCLGAAGLGEGPAVASTSGTLVSPETRICGQIKHGPLASGMFPLTGKTLNGTSWTVFSDGLPCSLVMAKTPSLLKQWAKAKPASELHPGLPGYICTRDTKGSVIGRCIKAGSNKSFEFWMTGPYALAQLKALKVIGH